MIDLHSHILPGVDDGVRTVQEALALARAAVADGVRVLAATPHVREDYPTSADTMERLVAEVRDRLREESIPLDLRTGGEVALDRLELLGEDEIRRFGLGGNPSYLLVEFPYVGWPLAVEQQVAELKERGVTAVLAHPERNSDVQARPERLRGAVEAGALVQLTAASVDGRLGRPTRATAFALLEHGLAHMVASDAHAPELRAVGLRPATEAVGSPLAEWLTEGMPGAIVRGEPLPPAPPVEPRKRRRLSFRR